MTMQFVVIDIFTILINVMSKLVALKLLFSIKRHFKCL